MLEDLSKVFIAPDGVGLIHRNESKSLHELGRRFAHGRRVEMRSGIEEDLRSSIHHLVLAIVYPPPDAGIFLDVLPSDCDRRNVQCIQFINLGSD